MKNIHFWNTLCYTELSKNSSLELEGVHMELRVDNDDVTDSEMLGALGQVLRGV